MKDYKRILEGVVNIINTTEKSDIGFTNICSYIGENCPELKESEGEKIRKALIHLVNSNKELSFGIDNYDGIKWSDILAWLEKQDEQKPNANYLLSWSEMDEKMLKSLEGIVKDYWAKAEQEKNEIKIREASNVSYFLKTIQKSPLCWIKCSDGLPNRDGIYLVVTDGLHNEVYDMARYDSIEGWHKASEVIYWMPIPQLNNKSIIEQNSSWSEEDERNLYYWLDNNKLIGNDKHRWLLSLKDRVQPQPMQEWSEEDISKIDRLIMYFKGKDNKEFTDWFSLLKDRYTCWKNKNKYSLFSGSSFLKLFPVFFDGINRPE